MRDKKGRFIATHGKKDTKLYKVWCGMKERCCNPKNKRYSNYGKRVITVCEEWKCDFSAFYNWALSNGYQEGLTIDRINNNGNYEPNNCRWVTRKEQNRNYSRNHNITYKGKTKCVTEWAEEYGIKAGTILYRLRQGKSVEEAFAKEDGRRTRWKIILPN